MTAHNDTQRHTDLICEKDAARILSLSHRTLRNWRVRGDGPPYIRISARCIRYDRSDLEAWANARRQRSTSDTLSNYPDKFLPARG